MARKSRIALLTIWSVIVLVIFFGFHRNQTNTSSDILSQFKETKPIADTSPDSGKKIIGKISKQEVEKAIAEKAAKKKALDAIPPAANKANTNEALTNEAGSVFDPAKEYEAVLKESPAAKQLLMGKYQIIPPPVVVELDQHPNGAEFQDYIGKQTGRATVPNVHVSKISRGGGDDFKAFDASGHLLEKMRLWADGQFTIELAQTPAGGVPDGAPAEGVAGGAAANAQKNL